MFGKIYHLVNENDCNGKYVERWILADATVAKAQEVVDPDLEKLAVDCRTDKDKNVVKTKIAGINVVCFPCGTILSMQELFGSESLSQVLLPIHDLMSSSTLRRDVKGV